MSRVCCDVCFHARVVSCAASRHWDWYCGVAVQAGWAGGKFDFLPYGIHDGPDLCECFAVGVCGCLVLWIAV